MEVAKNQRHRNEKRKRKTNTRPKAGARRSKRLKEIQAEIKIERDEEPQPTRPTLSRTPSTDNSSEAQPDTTTTYPNTAQPDTAQPDTTQAHTSTEAHTSTDAQMDIPVEIDEVKREVLESDIPILNLPVTENQETEQEHEYLYENHLDMTGTDIKIEEEDLIEPAGKMNIYLSLKPL